MKRYCVAFLLLLALSSAWSQTVVDFNEALDTGFTDFGEIVRKVGANTIHLPEGSFGSWASFKESLVTGMDSISRTGNCTATTRGHDTSYNYHVGWRLFQRTFESFQLGAKDMSAGYRIKDISVNLAFTLSTNSTCKISLDHVGFERMAKVDFFSSFKEFDGSDVEKEFKEVVLPQTNEAIDKAQIEKDLQGICDMGTAIFEAQMAAVVADFVLRLVK